MAMHHLSARRVVGALLAALLPLVAVLATAGPANAEDGYRYWNYSHLKGDTFEFAQTGPGDHTPKDGDVEGWRFGTSTPSAGIEPRADLAEVNFDSVCGASEAAEGEKRVAVLVDYGVEADADGAEVPEPVAECAVVPENANGQQTLESVVDVRSEGGLICALNGYPASGCGDPVADAQVDGDESTVAFTLPASAQAEEPEAGGESGSATDPAAAEESEEGGLSPALIAVLVLIVVLALVAVPLYRRNRTS